MIEAYFSNILLYILANLIDKDLKKKIDLVTSYRLFNDTWQRKERVVENVCYIN